MLKISKIHIHQPMQYERDDSKFISSTINCLHIYHISTQSQSSLFYPKLNYIQTNYSSVSFVSGSVLGLQHFLTAHTPMFTNKSILDLNISRLA